ncbi:hypothetical protein HNQ81_000863, partial [Desulfoprunum benzoelyticum]|nr:hypothetical protein [Desulfoprunum benzoelyticum]
MREQEGEEKKWRWGRREWLEKKGKGPDRMDVRALWGKDSAATYSP